MTQHSDTVRLWHMLDHAREAVAMAAGKTRQDLDSDRQLNLALVRLLEIVGEAAARITPATRAQIPSVSWQEVIGLRNRLIHGYDQVDFDILWDIITQDLPPLVAALAAFLAGQPSAPQT